MKPQGRRRLYNTKSCCFLKRPGNVRNKPKIFRCSLSPFFLLFLHFVVFLFMLFLDGEKCLTMMTIWKHPLHYRCIQHMYQHIIAVSAAADRALKILFAEPPPNKTGPKLTLGTCVLPPLMMLSLECNLHECYYTSYIDLLANLPNIPIILLKRQTQPFNHINPTSNSTFYKQAFKDKIPPPFTFLQTSQLESMSTCLIFYHTKQKCSMCIYKADTSIKLKISLQSTSMLKSCIYTYLIQQLLPSVTKENWSSAHFCRISPREKEVAFI